MSHLFAAAFGACLVSAPAWAQASCQLEQVIDPQLVNDAGGSHFASAAEVAALSSGAEIYSLDLATREVQQLTPDNNLVGSPYLKDDASMLVFVTDADLVGQNADGNFEIVLWDGRQFTQLTDSTGGGNFQPHLSRDGAHVLFNSSNDYTGANPNLDDQLFTVDVESGEIRQESSLDDAMFGFNATEDHRRAAFISTGDPLGQNADGNQELFLLDLEQGTLRQLTQTLDGQNSGFSISDDGTRIAFITNSGDLLPPGQRDIMLYNDLDQSITRIRSAPGFLVGASISRSGDRIIASLGETVYIIDVSFGEEVIVADSPFGSITHATSADFDGDRVIIRSHDDFTGENPDGSFEHFLVTCDLPWIFADGFESGNMTRWAARSK